ncbi:MAG: glycosyltransferase family 4 protein [Cyclobacteriaceae bacterium]|nr:glycosyltransferase family 4 protein [Cyclobacteriaceae bacterium]
MSGKQPELIAFSQHKLGGVQSYYANLLSHDRSNAFHKKWILTDQTNDVDARLAIENNFCEQQIVRWSGSWNMDIAKQLSACVSSKPGVVMTNHEPELMALRMFPRKHKTICFVCHDALYLDNALRYEFMIDVFIAHNEFFFNELKSRLPAARVKDIYYLPYGIVLAPEVRKENPTRILKVLFIARLHQGKGIYDLEKIDTLLTNQNIHVEWTIVGDGPEKTNLIKALAARANFTFLTLKTTANVFETAVGHDIFVLPSYLEGLPVALLEAMSAGLVPIIYKFNSGIEKVVTNDNGFIVPVGDFQSIAEVISKLQEDRQQLEEKSKKARLKVEQEYEVGVRAQAYYSLFSDFKKLKRPYQFKRLPGDGRLDYPFIPQFVREGARKVRAWF